MLANEARQIASKVIWKRLPNVIKYAIEDATKEGKLNCELCFSLEETSDFEKCIKYFDDLKELGYKPDMHTARNSYRKGYVITIMW